MQSPQMIQAMKILQLPALDLLGRIQQELEENPMLELREPEEAAPEGEPAAPRPAEGAGGEADREGVQRMLEHLERLERDFGEGSRSRSGDGEESDRKLAALQNTPDLPKTMAQALSEELGVLDLDPRERTLAEILIYSLDERGYLGESLEALAAELNDPRQHGPGAEEGASVQVENGHEPGSEEAPVTAAELAAVLARLRELIHPGLGARDLRETLLLQLEAAGRATPLLTAIVSSHLEDLQQNRLPRIAKATGHSIEEVKEAVEELKHLDPTPCAAYGDERAAVILPDVLVELVDGEYVVRLDRQRVPELTLSKTYRELLEKAKKGDAVDAWLRKRLESARWFIDAVGQRQSTLERIAKVIFEHQRPFLDKGLSALQTLRMQEVADQVGVHISTVSRAVSGKYAQTPRGIFPLKFFFTGGTTNVSGEVTSQVGIQQRIKELVDQEDPAHPLSDEEIAERLKEKDRIEIARRTVTKYRKMLSIPPSSQRKRF